MKRTWLTGALGDWTALGIISLATVVGAIILYVWIDPLWAYIVGGLMTFIILSELTQLGLREAWTRLTRRPAARGHCPTCGYDLRASPDRCPECGTTVKPQLDACERR